MDRDQCIVDYINGKSKSIEGWLYPLDMLLWYALDGMQKTSQIVGNVCEVGVYKGKSLALLGMLTRESETVFAFDAFPNDWLQQTQQAMAELCPWAKRVQYVKGNTADYTLTLLNERIQSKVRFLHIDAGHEYHEVLHALYLFAPYVAADGIIIMDDYQDREFPGVAAATLDFCEQSRSRPFVPFLSGANKMFLCAPAMAQRYQHGLIRHPNLLDTMRLSRIRDHVVLISASREPMTSDGIAKLIDSDTVHYLDDGDLAALAELAAQKSQERGRAAAGIMKQ